MIPREISDELVQLTNEYPVVTVLGPRQSGKTTLVKHLLEGYEYSNLEHPETRHFAESDPIAYLAQFDRKLIIDEVQRLPNLLSYIQVIVDEKQQNGQFILTGSHQLQLQDAIGQSLAGRTSILNLLPLTIRELRRVDKAWSSFEKYCIHGFFPRVHDQSIRPFQMYSNYYRTYAERDVRQLINLKDASLFENFIKLVAGRVGQVIDYASLANDVGVDGKTIKNWLSILEASYLLFKLPPYFENFGKRVIKSPKFYFVDVGLLCYLLGIETVEQLKRDPLVGNIFENLVVLEAFKMRFNQGRRSNLYFFRDSHGNEVDLILQQGNDLLAIEIKSAATFSMHHLKGGQKFRKLTDRCKKSCLVYSGKNISLSDNQHAINFVDFSEFLIGQRHDCSNGLK